MSGTVLLLRCHTSLSLFQASWLAMRSEISLMVGMEDKALDSVSLLQQRWPGGMSVLALSQALPEDTAAHLTCD